MNPLVRILIMLVMLGVLISLHELGHLLTAKLFKVYCFEYSIGFGPKLFSHKRRGGETSFSLRIIPLGGYVMMYGESDSVPEGLEKPDESRSLESISKWKKALIMSAGIIVNFFLGLILIFVSCAAFPQYYMLYGSSILTPENKDYLSYSLRADYADSAVDLSSAASSRGIEESDFLIHLGHLIYTVDGVKSTIPVIDDYVEVKMGYENLVLSDYPDSEGFVAVYYCTNLTSKHSFDEGIRIYPSEPEATLDSKQIKAKHDYGYSHVPSKKAIAKGDYLSFPAEYEYKYDLDITFVSSKLYENESANEGVFDKNESGEYVYSYSLAHRNDKLKRTVHMVPGSKKTDIKIPPIRRWNSFSEAFYDWKDQVPKACTSIIMGFASIFKDGIKNVSGVVGMTSQIGLAASIGGGSMIFFYAGAISINLAFFNLLPFPGLDGWHLLVTAIEGITRKKVPQKVKGIFSAVGLILLLALGILVTIKDILAIF